MAERGWISKSILTNIANAIRAKTGSTATMLPTEMAGLIAGISGTPEGLTAVEYGEIVPAVDWGELTFQHSMGVVPRAGVLWLASNDEVGEASNENVVVACFANYMDYGYVACETIGGDGGNIVPGEWTNYFSTTHATFIGTSFAVGRKYNYIICA